MQLHIRFSNQLIQLNIISGIREIRVSKVQGSRMAPYEQTTIQPYNHTTILLILIILFILLQSISAVADNHTS